MTLFPTNPPSTSATADTILSLSYLTRVVITKSFIYFVNRYDYRKSALGVSYVFDLIRRQLVLVYNGLQHLEFNAAQQEMNSNNLH